jgi:dienelactone hydrolase
MPRWSVGLVIAVVVTACRAAAPRHEAAARPGAAPLLRAGPHRVGFRAAWTFDEARRYRTAFDDGATYGGATGAPRPILVNLWYPADGGGQAMTRAIYLRPPDAPPSGALAAALGSYARGITAQEAFGADESALSPELRRRFADYLAAPLTAARDAPPSSGRFPIVIYHAGAGSSYADNVELCEHLASHGYVVLGSAFLQPDGASLNIGEGWRDFEILIAWARQLPFADAARVGGLGHSAGAQAMLQYAAEPHPRMGALALLDTTVDYHGIVYPLHAIVPELLARRAAVTTPLLAVAKPYAVFALLDELDGSDRTYLTVHELEHDEFLGHGVTRSTLPDVAADRAPRVLAAYRAVADAVVAFFDRELRGDRAAARHLAALAASPLDGDAPRVEVRPRGARRPPPYDASTGRPPSPRELRPVLDERGAAATIALLRTRRGADPTDPVYTRSELACSLLYELVGRDRRDDAVLLFGYFHALHPELVDELVAWARMAELFKKPDVARRYAGAALLFMPDHAGARAFAAPRP